jgi:hypothetical protein
LTRNSAFSTKEKLQEKYINATRVKQNIAWNALKKPNQRGRNALNANN